MKQTAVEWLEEEIEKRYGLTPTSILLFRDAKEMEKQEQENFAAWCIKKRVDLFDNTEIGETYTIDGFVSRYKMNELLEMYRNTTQSVV
jgi:hypothetical protein